MIPDGHRLITAKLLLACLLLLRLAPSANAQTTATVIGAVTDPQSLPVPGAEVKIKGEDVAVLRTTTTDVAGLYRLPALPPGSYSLIVSKTGFTTTVNSSLQLTINRTIVLDVSLRLETEKGQVEVPATPDARDTTSSSSSMTITPEQIANIPLNGRDYLDLLQMVPGININRQADSGSDDAVSILGERGNNTGYLIDGLNNSNEVTGGPAAQFNLDTIAEFQVVTTGYKAEFGHASGGMINVITRSGNQQLHGLASVFLRNNVLDASDVPGAKVPYLLRWDYDGALGGTLIKDKAFWFGSVERIHQNQQLNFVIPIGTPAVLVASESAYGTPSTDREMRAFGKLTETLGKHRLAEEMNYTNTHIGNFLPLSQSTNLPSTRLNTGLRTVMAGISDIILLGDQGNPFVVTLYGQYRAEPSAVSPAHPQAGPATAFFAYSGYDTGLLLGDLGTFTFGAETTTTTLKPTYGSSGASILKVWRNNTFKLGYDYLRTQLDGVEGQLQENELWATLSDYQQFGPLDAGIYLLTTTGGATPQDSEIHIRDNYDGAYLQDDLRVARTLTINAGIRWDYDSEFKIKTNFSPRLGFAWAASSKTIVRSSFGVFYDHFRLGVAQAIPGFGGADLATSGETSYPRLFYGVPTTVPELLAPHLCLSPTLTQAQLTATNATCTYPGLQGQAIFGVDYLNDIVVPGHAPIPANSVVTSANIQALSGLSPQAYLNEASLAIGQQPGFLFFNSFGALSHDNYSPGSYPVTLDPSFATPYTRSYTLGAQRELPRQFILSVDYYHKAIENILGVRNSAIPFAARVDSSLGGVDNNSYGPWYSGRYNSGVVSFERRMSSRFTLGGSYAYTSEIDDDRCSDFVSGPTGVCLPTDSFRGITTLATDPLTGRTNANGAFYAANGAFVPKAGIYYNGATLDEGPSDLSLRHVLQLHGLVQLPFKIEVSGIFRVQSGFRYTQSASIPVDEDGSNQYDGRDLKTGRNQFQAPPFVNQDLRMARTFRLTERIRLRGILEFFNLFNNANPAAVQVEQSGLPKFGSVTQTLPGRQGQAGLRLEF
jgi:hypothetical protein